MAEKLTFIELMATLDSHLTGKDFNDCQRTLRQQDLATVDAWLENEQVLYLSDSGYSRIFFNIGRKPNYTVRLFLTDNSLDRAKQEWTRHQALIRRIEEMMTERLKELLQNS